MPVYFHHPQFADTLKHHDFLSNPVTPSVETPANGAVQTTDTTGTKKSKPKSKKDKKEKTPEQIQADKKKKEEKTTVKKNSKEKTAGQAQSGNAETKKKNKTILTAEIKDSIKIAPPVSLKIINPALFLCDTISPIKSSAPPQSFFTEHQLPAKKGLDSSPVSHPAFWINLIVLLVVASFVWIRTSYGKRFSRTISAFFNIREFFQLVREEYSMTNGLSVLLSLIYICTTSVFIYQTNQVYHIFAITFSPFLFFLSVTGIISLVFILKLLMVRVIGTVFYNKSDQAMPFVYNIFLTNNMIGILLLPVALILSYVLIIPKEIVIYVTAALILGLYIYRITRALAISTSESGVSNLYFFSYLCTLDFVPFIVLLKQLDTRF